jgi:glycosyltransferase involved in cell wall biosynthesis
VIGSSVAARALGGDSDADSATRTSPAQSRLLFLINTLDPAGPELRLLDFARGFPKTTAVHICALTDRVALLHEFEQTRAKVVVLPLKRAYLQWHRVAEILAYARDLDVRVVNSFDLKSLLVAVAAKLRSGGRVRLVHHIVGLWEDLAWRHKIAMWRLLDFVDVVVCNGEAVHRIVVGSRRLRAQVAIIPNGVDCGRFSTTQAFRVEARSRLGYRPDQFVLGTVANVRPVKNYPFLLRSMRRLAHEHQHVQLLCVGAGPQLEEMKQLVITLGLENRVNFVGSAIDIRGYLAAMDAFALCSFTEGCPNSLMQAMAMSVPVVASSVGEVPYLVQDGASGMLFSLPDEDAFCGSISRLIDDPQFRSQLGAAGRQRMERTYAQDRMIEQYLTLMNRLAAATR